MEDHEGVQKDRSGTSIRLTQVEANRSVPTATLQTLIKPFRTHLVEPGKPLPAGSQKLQVPSSIQSGYEVTEALIEDIWIYNLSPRHLEESFTSPHRVQPEHRAFYFAGGGFQAPPSKDHWKFLAQLTRELFPVYRFAVVSYPLAPNSPASASLPVLDRFLQHVLKRAADDGASVTLAGDSSGGNIALSMAMKAVSTDRFGGARGHLSPSTMTPLKNVLVISPPVDMRVTNPEIAEANKHDPVLSRDYVNKVARTWAGDLPRHDPAISPLLADLTQLKRSRVKVHGVVGTFDVLAPDAILFRKRLEEVGIEGEWLEAGKQMHCFPLAFHYGLPESVRGKEWIVDVLRRNA